MSQFAGQPGTPGSPLGGPAGSATETSGQHRVADLAALELERDRQVARLTLLVLLVPTLWFLQTDLSVGLHDGTLFTDRFAVRLFFLGALVFGAIRLGTVRDRDAYESAVLITSVVTAVCIVTLNALRPEGSTLPLRTPLMWLLAYYAGLVNRPRYQMIAPFTISLGIILLRLFWVDSGATGTIEGDILVVLVMNAIGLLLIRHREMQSARAHALWEAERATRASLERTMSELKQLRGIIPICAHCKEVRTELGGWQQIESYVRAHTEAEFSHGICPRCVEKHFGESAVGSGQ